MKSSIRNEIKAQIIRAGYTMQEVVDLLHDEYGWSDSVSNLSGKLQRESLRYRVKERKARTRRLIQEGAILEKAMPEVRAMELSDLESYLLQKR